MGALRTTRRGNATTISYDGPFFTKDPGETLEDNIDTMLRAMSKEAAEDVRAQVDSHQHDMPRWTGFSASRVTSRHDIPWRDGRGYSLIWTSTYDLPGRPESKAAGSVGSRNRKTGGQEYFRGNAAAIVLAAMSSIEGRWHPFRVTKNRISKARALQKAELTKGME